MNIGGYFPFRTERERFDLRINAGFFDDIGDRFSDAFGGGDNERGAFESGQNVEVVDRSFQSPGTTGAEIGKDSEFFRAKSRGELVAGQGIAGLVGAGLGIPGLSTLFSNIASRPVFATDAQGNRIQVQGPQGGSGSAGGGTDRLALEQAIAATGGATISGGGSNVAVTVNQQGQLVDNSGNTVNEQGQRVDADGRLMSEADIAIQQALGFTQEAATGAAGEIRGGQEAASGFLGGGAHEATVAARRAAIRGRDFLQGAETRGQEFLTGGEDRAQGFLRNQADQGISGIEQQLGITQERIDPFTQAGTRALEREQAFLGLLGPEAQRAFFAEQTLSPAQLALEQNEEQALLRRQAATGGIIGGRQLLEAGRAASGRASTILENQLGRLSTLSGRGQQSAIQQGQFGQQSAGSIANIRSQLGGRQSQLATDLARSQTGLATTTGTNLANIVGNLGGQEVGIQSGLGANQANLAAGTSTNLANILTGQGANQSQAVLGQQVARAGEQSQANQLAQQRDIADQQFNQQLLGLGAQVFQKPISNFLSGLF